MGSWHSAGKTDDDNERATTLSSDPTRRLIVGNWKGEGLAIGRRLSFKTRADLRDNVTNADRHE